MIRFKDVCFSYMSDGSRESQAIRNVSFAIEKGDFVGIAGSVGSGKTTLCKLLSGLLKPVSGQIERDESIAFAMQFPESQIFEGTVIKDVMFGPLNRGLDSEAARDVATRSLGCVGLDQSFFDRSPFCLSGGEKRRVALAGVLAMESDVLVLDEPAAGLDPKWHDKLYSLLEELNSEGKTIVVVSHEIDDMAEHCKTLLVLEQGRLKDMGNAREVICRCGYQTKAMAFAQRLKTLGMDIDCTEALTAEDLAGLIAERRMPR